jgi:hypothetical protein
MRRSSGACFEHASLVWAVPLRRVVLEKTAMKTGLYKTLKKSKNMALLMHKSRARA